VEEQRRGAAGDLGGQHLAHEDGVVAARVGVRDPAVQPGQRPAEHGGTGGRGGPRPAGEPVARVAAGEPVADAALVLAEEADGEHAAALDQPVRVDVLGEADQHQRRVEADTAERAGRHAVPAVPGGGGDDRDAGRPLAEHRPERLRVDRHGTDPSFR
jgi:hypothetical protein